MGKVKKPKKKSLFRDIILYMLSFIFLSFFLIIAINLLCSGLKDMVLTKYALIENLYFLTTEEGEQLGDGAYIGAFTVPFSDEDTRFISALETAEVLTTVATPVLCLLGVSYFFYRNKLKKPISELTRAADKIADNDLDFNIKIYSNDELGRLCMSFDRMRGALAEDFSELWRQIEERKRLNAAFAHDLRTPLTVLKGYGEILQSSSDSKTAETARIMSKHIARLERYADSMSKLQRLEENKACCSDIEAKELAAVFEETGQLLAKQDGKSFCLFNDIASEKISIDGETASQVYNNLLSNAVRYANEKICVRLWETEELFLLQVSDDGKGFSREGIKRAAEPYYSGEDKQGENFGLGLYICKTLCRQHGGELFIESSHGGGRIRAEFRKSWGNPEAGEEGEAQINT